MEIILNGVPTTTQAGCLTEMIREQEIPTAGLAVAVADRVVRRTDWDSTPLHEGMVITLIRATQGG